MTATNTTSTMALAAAGGYCMAWISVGQHRDDRGALPAAHLLHHEVVAHHLGEHQDRAERDAGLATAG